MSRKQIIINLCLVLVLTGLGWFCYQAGKTYDILLENLPYQTAGAEGISAEQPALEAIYATVDNGKKILMLEGDRTMATGSGGNHRLKIEILDEDDNVVETREIPFSRSDLGDKPAINVARAYREGAI